MSVDRFALGARREAESARKEARPEARFGGAPVILRRGKVTGESTGAAGTYDVNVIGQDGATEGSLTRVPVFPSGGATLGADTQVWLVYETGGGRQHPTILATEAGGGNMDWGVVTD